MHLERILTYRFLRLMKGVLPALVVVLTAIPAWNYYARRAHRNGGARAGVKLPSGVSVRTDGFTYSQTEGGRTQFTVRAKQSLGFKDDKYILQDVDADVYGATDAEPVRHIRGARCEYQDDAKSFTCTGDVEIDFDESTTLHTTRLVYDHQTRAVTGPEPAAFEQAGTTGRADAFDYQMDSGLLKLNGNVHVETADHVQIETAAAVFQQKQNWAVMSGGVLVQSRRGWIRGATGRADLQPGSYKPKTIILEGGVAAESHAEAGAESWTVQSDWMQAVLSPEGSAEQVHLRGRVAIEKAAGDARQSLKGGEVDATLKDGRVDAVEAREMPRMTFGPDQTLEAARIWMNSAGSIRTDGASLLRVGDSTIEGRQFFIDRGDVEVRFRTDLWAALKKSGGQESSSDRTEARFDSRTNMLVNLVQRGNFQFRSAPYSGRAETGRFEDGGFVVTLNGSPIVTDDEKQLQAAEIKVNQKDNSFAASRNVSMLIRNSGEQALVKADHAEGGAGSVFYTGNVRLWRGDVYIQADRLAASTEARGGRLHAEAAVGRRVESHLQNIRASSQMLDYDDSSGVVRYQGAVRAQKDDIVLTAADMTVHLREGMVADITAVGDVVAVRGDQRGAGDQAVYDAATGVVTLTGKNARVGDKEHAVFTGAVVRMENKGETASVAGGNGDRTVTTHPVQRKK